MARMSAVLPIVCLFLALSAWTARGAKIVIVGDSMGDYACDYLGLYCGDATVVNQGIGGTTADQWATTGAESMATTAFDGQTGVTHVWISLLGNDLFGNCAITSAELTTKLTNAYTEIKRAASVANTNVRYVLTSYCNPRGTDSCDPGYDVSRIQAAMTAVADAQSDVTFVDVGTACGGSNTAYGDAQYFQDNIHLNKRGYCTVFNLPAVQNAFECTQSADSCTCTTVTGQCQHGTAVSTPNCDATSTPTPTECALSGSEATTEQLQAGSSCTCSSATGCKFSIGASLYFCVAPAQFTAIQSGATGVGSVTAVSGCASSPAASSNDSANAAPATPRSSIGAVAVAVAAALGLRSCM